MGVVVGGFGGGAFIFNQIQVTSHANTKYHKKNRIFSYSTKYRLTSWYSHKYKYIFIFKV